MKCTVERARPEWLYYMDSSRLLVWIPLYLESVQKEREREREREPEMKIRRSELKIVVANLCNLMCHFCEVKDLEVTYSQF